jgi:cell division protein FtsI/penicillin-binding protein 2
MRPRRIHLASIALLLVFWASACAGTNSESGTDENSARIQSEHLSTIGAKDFDPTNFDNSTTVDNKWFPLVLGAQSVFEGSAIDDGERISRRVVSTVTDLSKEINGLDTIVVWERDYSEGELVEAELAFFAQDDYGNVWHMGE